MDNKEKRGFWASLFSLKPCKCSCEDKHKVSPEDSNARTVHRADNDTEETIDIKVLGPGCAKCKSTFSVIEKVIKDIDCDATLTKVEDIEEIMSYNIMTTPAVVINGKVVIKGKVPTESEIKQILGIN